MRKRKHMTVFMALLIAGIMISTDFASAIIAENVVYAQNVLAEGEEMGDESGDGDEADADTEFPGEEETEATEATEIGPPEGTEIPTEEPTEEPTETEFDGAKFQSWDVELDVDLQTLIVTWSGERAAYISIYMDDEEIASEVTESYFTEKVEIEPESKHTFRLTAYDENGEEGQTKEFVRQAGNYTAVITSMQVEYDETKKQVSVEWKGAYVAYVDIYLNDTLAVTEYKKETYVLDYSLQPGKEYNVMVVPYNIKKDMGAAMTHQLSEGDFELPDAPELEMISLDIRDSGGNLTGFYRPAVKVKWTAQKDAYYEIYRASNDKQGSYVWIASVKADADGEYIYTDSSVVPEDYYYKIRRKIADDPFVTEELYSALSDSEWIDLSIPRATVRTELSEKDGVMLTLNVRRDYVSGYEIYRASGNRGYKKIAEVSGNTYEDKEVKFGTLYYYRVRAFYYDSKTKKRIYGPYSISSRAKNTVGPVTAQVKTLSSTKVKVSWTKASNADGYEVYYKSALAGDSYALIADTQKLSLNKKLKSGRKYTFMIKAYGKNKKGKTYFSIAEISVRTGFATPEGFRIAKTSYGWDPEKKQVIQRDKLAWDRVYGADGYYIERYNKETKQYDMVTRVKKNSITSYTVANPVTQNEEMIEYRISAYLGAKKLDGKVIQITPKLGQVQNVRVGLENSKVTVRWKSQVAADSYQVYRSNGRTMVLVGETANRYFVDYGLDLGASYTYYVRAVSKSLNQFGEYSEPVTYTRRPSTVMKVTAKNTKAGAASLRWQSVQNAASYIIYYSDEKDGQYKKLAQVRGRTSYTHRKLEKGNVYYYKVTAVRTNRIKLSVESLKSSSAKVKIVK